MICEMIMIAGLSVSSCSIEALEVSPLKPQSSCIVHMKTGKRYKIGVPCVKAHEKLFSKKENETPDNNIISFNDIGI